MTTQSMLLGPGYYNVNHKSSEHVCPSFSFEAIQTLNFNPDKIDNYAKEMKQIKADKEQRIRDRQSMLEKEADKADKNTFRQTKDSLMTDMVETMETGG